MVEVTVVMVGGAIVMVMRDCDGGRSYCDGEEGL